MPHTGMLQRKHAQVAVTADSSSEEACLLAGNSTSSAQVALPELPYSLEQLQQVQVAATAIVASKADIQQCTVVLQSFPWPNTPST